MASFCGRSITRQQDRIVVIRETNLPQFPEFSVSPPNYLDWAKQTKSWQ